MTDELLKRLENCKFADDLCREIAKEIRRLREDNRYLKDPLRHCCDLQDKLREENAKHLKTLAAALDLMDKLSNPGTDWRVRPNIGDVRKFLRDLDEGEKKNI